MKGKSIGNPRKRSNVDISKSAPVIGIVVHRSQELFTIDIGISVPCSLPSAAFEGSTKRNLPNLHVGDLVYAKIHSNIPETEIVLTCINKNQKADGLGKLDNEGLIFQMPQSAINM
ncbi:MAG: Exosome component 3 [Paramarteilia canceri]